MIGPVERAGRWPAQPWRWVAVMVTVGGIALAQRLALRLPAGQADPIVIANHLYALLLLAGLLILTAGVGRAAVRITGLEIVSRVERHLFATALGAGIVSYVVLAIGLVGLLRPSVLAVTMLGLAVLCRYDVLAAAQDLRWLIGAAWAARRRLGQEDRILRLAVLAVEAFLLLVLVEALAPPTGYDPLMYHLQGAKRFLEIGRIVPLPDVQQANMPFAVDMLYLLGLAFGSDELANVCHMAFCLLVVVATFSFARAFIGERVAWIASISFLSTLMIFVFAPMANIDYGMALFDFLAVYATVRWVRERDGRWLVLAGALCGFALGSKYLGAITAGALGLFVLATALRSDRPLSARLALVVAFGLAAALIASPWYVKNELWLGSPIWPFLAPSPTPYNIVISPNTNFGRGFWDVVQLPLRLYLNGSLEYPGARPPVLLLLLPLYAVVPKHRLVTGLLALAAVHLVVWVQGAHVLRYLTAALPELCIGAAYVAVQLGKRPGFGPRGPALISAIVALCAVIPLAVTARIELEQQPFAQLVGLESRRSYLTRMLPNHALVAFANDEGDAVKGVLLIGDRRAFYVAAPTWVDVSLGAFETLATAPTADDARAYLAGLGVSHVLLSEPDLAWHTGFDPEGRILGWWGQFKATRSEYLVPEATYFDLTLYRVVDAAEAQSTGQARPPVDLSTP